MFVALASLFIVIAFPVFLGTRREGRWTYLGVLLFSASVWLLVVIWLAAFILLSGIPQL